MIVVRVELWSAVTGKKTELARMRICNVGGTVQKGNYEGHTFFGRSSDALDKERVIRTGSIEAWPRLSQHVWNLVARMLQQMGYGS